MTMNPEQKDRLLHALDLMILADYDSAKRLLESESSDVAQRVFLLVCELEQRVALRTQANAVSRHEIGNALTVARANIEGIADGVLEASQQRYDGIREALAGASMMVADIGRPPAEPMTSIIRVESFNICALIHAQIEAIDAMAKAKRVDISFQKCGDDHDGKPIRATCMHYRGDPVRVGQILRNLLLNAVRYTPPGGAVMLSCELEDETALRVHIADTGPGISDADRERIFDYGFRAAPRMSPGEGLGLGVVQSILTAIGGHALVEETSQHGTIFDVRLPMVPLEGYP